MFANLLSRYWLLWSVALQVNRRWTGAKMKERISPPVGAEVTQWLLRLQRHRVVHGNLFLLPPKVQSHAAKKSALGQKQARQTDTLGLLGSGSPVIMTGVRTVSGLMKAWDSDKTHMAPVQEIMLLLSHWANYRYDVKFKGPPQPDLYVELQKRAPRPDPSTCSRTDSYTLFFLKQCRR